MLLLGTGGFIGCFYYLPFGIIYFFAAAVNKSNTRFRACMNLIAALVKSSLFPQTPRKLTPYNHHLLLHPSMILYPSAPDKIVVFISVGYVWVVNTERLVFQKFIKRIIAANM
jgi:hypothetical protein